MNGLLLCLSLALFVTVCYANDEPCDARGRSCVTGKATCVDESCVCNPPATWGDGSFNCYNDNTYVAQILNEPDLLKFDDSLIHSFNNETVTVPFPCRYLATHFVTELNDGEKRIGACEFMIHAFNNKNKGKFFLHGFDVALRLKYADDTVDEMSSRHFGVAQNGAYQFKNKGFLETFNPDGPWRKDKIRYKNKEKGVFVTVGRDELNHQLTYVADQCGVRMTFVPYDIMDRHQVSISGLSIAIDRKHEQDGMWLSKDEVMVLPYGASYDDKEDPKMTREEAIFYRGFKTPIVQNAPLEDKGKCELIHKSLEGAEPLQARRAMNNCYWILSNPEFIWCFEWRRSARNILRLFNECVQIYTGEAECSDVIRAISKSGCDRKVEGIKELPKFMAGELCPAQ